MTSFETLIFGALIGLASSIGLRAWQNERERWVKRVDEFCELLVEASDEAVEFWIASPDPNIAREQRRREIRIIGLQIRLEGLLDTFLDKLSAADQDAVQRKVAALREAMTGGSFQSQNNGLDFNKAREVQAVASELFVLARSATDQAMRIWRLSRPPEH
jgi:hypothetical protein